MKKDYFEERETRVYQSKGLANKSVINKISVTFDKEYDFGYIKSVIYNADNGYVFWEERIPISGAGIVKLYSMLDGVVDAMAHNRLAKGGKIGFKALSEKVAKNYAGKSVPAKYRKEYGKRYDKGEAKEVGNKVAAKVYRSQLAKKMASGGELSHLMPNTQTHRTHEK
jgi:hypothetical protein